ncbi:MAG: hypothetical protein OQK71_08155 [Desulfobacter sp.]|nr:hypothetical protein [Desulfobacter sp.]
MKYFFILAVTDRSNTMREFQGKKDQPWGQFPKAFLIKLSAGPAQ